MHSQEDTTDSIVGFVAVSSIAAVAIFFLGGFEHIATPFVWLALAFVGTSTWFFKLVVASVIQYVVAAFVLAVVVWGGQKYFKKAKNEEPK